MKSIVIIYLLMASFGVIGQQNCNIQDAYKEMFSVTLQTYGEQTFVRKIVNEVAADNCFASLVNDNTLYIDYIYSNFTDYSKVNDLKNISDSVARQQQFIENLRTDSLFNSIMQRLDDKINNPKSFIPDTVSMDELMNYAVKFFLIKGINEAGHYLGQVCNGINGLELTKEVRNPHVEALCFTTILNHYSDSLYSMQDELIKGIKEVYKIELGTNEDDRLLRAQGAMFAIMRNNEVLRKTLLKTYHNKKGILPFVIAN